MTSMSCTYPPIPIDAAKNFQGRVVIIGAGMSGLMAANTLKYMGVDDYIVLEASDIMGGRIKHIDGFHDEVPLDIGAEWIHSTNKQILKDIMIFDAVEEEEGLQPLEFIRYKPEWFFRKKKNKFVTYLYEETKFKCSTWWHWLDQNVYQHVQEKVKFHSPVTEIIYSNSNSNSNTKEVKVITENGEIYKANKVICTIPLAVLKGQNAVNFVPPLPKNKLNAIEKVNMPPGFKILFEMKEKFYPDMTVNNGFLRQVMDGEDVFLIYDPLFGKELSSNQNLLVTLAVGPKHAGTLGQLGDDELVEAILAKIDKVFDGQGSKNYVKHVVQNWTLEPYILGSYSDPSTSKKLKKDLCETVGDNILFAGEHTSAKYSSTVIGAAIEGRRAAVEAVSGLII